MSEFDWPAAAAAAEEALGCWHADGPGGVVMGIGRGTVRFLAAAGRGGPGYGPLDADTVFRWASVTKHVFAACVLESEALPLDMPLGAALPELAPMPAAVTVAQALAMQGGLPDTRESLTLLAFGNNDRTGAAELLDWSAQIGRLNAAPGTEVAYSNAGYRLLEAALARRGFVFSEMVAAHAQRLGLGMVASEHWTDPLPGLVPGHVREAGGAWTTGFQGMHLSAAGSLSGSATDLALWLADLMPRNIFARMAEPLPLASGEATGYGLGLQLKHFGTMRVPGHGGAQPGYRSGFFCAPETGAALVVLANRDDGDAAGIATRIWRRLHGATEAALPAGDWAPPGLYAAPEGDLWAEVQRDAIVVRDADEPLFQGPDGWTVSHTPQSQMRLRIEDGALIGAMFHRPVRLLPVPVAFDAPQLDGYWICDGAVLRIDGDQLVWGAGPCQSISTLASLGNARWLFRANGRRICLSHLAPDRIGLSLGRSRVIEYRRL